MNNTILTDREFRHYQELTNFDPVVQRLCKMNYADDQDFDLKDQVDELEQQVDDLGYENEELRDDIVTLEARIKELTDKIQVWETLEKE